MMETVFKFAATSTIGVLAFGFLLGLKHATEADHLVAVSTVVSERRGLVKSAIVGALWGLGHTISLGRVGYGLVLTLVFSFGLAATLTAVGMVFLYVGKAFGGMSIAQSWLVKALPVFSALVIACVGAAICYSSLG